MPAVVVKKEKRQVGKGVMVVVSKKVSPKATERNRVKRRIKAILAGHHEETGAVYKVIVKPEAKNLTFKELKKQIEQQLS